jgi:hypothetical protein
MNKTSRLLLLLSTLAVFLCGCYVEQKTPGDKTIVTPPPAEKKTDVIVTPPSSGGGTTTTTSGGGQ